MTDPPSSDPLPLPSGRALAFVDRLGGMLVAPRTTLARVASGEGGFDDLTVLLLLRVVAGEPDRLTRAALSVPGLGLLGALQGVAQAVVVVLPDVGAMLIGGVLLALISRVARRGSGPSAARGRELDLAAAAWVPAVVVHLVILVLRHVAGVRSPGSLGAAVQLGAVVWAAACWVLALLEILRRDRPDAPPALGASA